MLREARQTVYPTYSFTPQNVLSVQMSWFVPVWNVRASHGAHVRSVDAGEAACTNVPATHVFHCTVGVILAVVTVAVLVAVVVVIVVGVVAGMMRKAQ